MNEHSLGPTQQLVLKHLGQDDRLTASRLAREINSTAMVGMGLHSSNAIRASLVALERRGFVERQSERGLLLWRRVPAARGE